MSVQLDDPLTPELRDILNNLAAGLFGLDAWVKEPGKYLPPNPNLPWRVSGHTFTPADLAVIPFFENLLRESSGDDDLGVRWPQLPPIHSSTRRSQIRRRGERTADSAMFPSLACCPAATSG